MIAAPTAFEPSCTEWRQLSDPSESGYRVAYETALLGYDLKRGVCDFLVRFDAAGEHRIESLVESFE